MDNSEDAHVVILNNEFIGWIYEWLETLNVSNEIRWMILVDVVEEHSPVMDGVVNEDWLL